jgi:tRNA-dihydrouridine synthase B
MTPKLYLAPIRGVTDAIYRNCFFKHFGGIDLAVAPFIATVVGKINPRILKDVIPENNCGIPVEPQILGKSAKDFIRLARRLFEMGYKTVNWNLGCPYPRVANKGRGSGILPQPDLVDNFLKAVLPEIPNTLSIKVRLGKERPDEIIKLLPVFNAHPLKEIIIHPRTARQMYSGNVDLEAFENALDLCCHPVIYNGDILDRKRFETLANRFTGVNGWMIGRGVLSDPFLPADIKNIHICQEDSRIDMIKDFHEDLFSHYGRTLSGPAHLGDRMKGIWRYLAPSFENGDKILKSINKTSRTQQYREIVDRFFREEAKWSPPKTEGI